MADDLTLVIANRNYSSWSLRPWLLMRGLGIPFAERQIRFGDDFARQARAVSPAARVPVLLAGTQVIWDSLAIIEFLAERFPALPVWPAASGQRALARSVCAEMHAGFGALRSAMPMNIEASLPGRGLSVKVQDDIDRVIAIWSSLRAAHRDQGPFLFGAFGAADAFYAPVVSRFKTHAVPLPADCQAYADSVQALPAMREWTTAALAECSFVAEDEPYRRDRGKGQ